MMICKINVEHCTILSKLPFGHHKVDDTKNGNKVHTKDYNASFLVSRPINFNPSKPEKLMSD